LGDAGTMRTSLLFGLLACGAPTDSDPAEPEPEVPNFNLRGTFWLDPGERLPTQSSTWCEDLRPDRLDWSEACFDKPISCEQGLDFQAPEAELLLELYAATCGSEDPRKIRASTSYSRFAFEGRDPLDPQVDRWQVNARIWLVRSLGGGEAEVASGEVVFHLRSDDRW